MRIRTVAVPVCVLLLLLPPSIPARQAAGRATADGGWELVTEVQKDVLIAPGKCYAAWYDNSTRQFQQWDAYSCLTAKAGLALDRTPAWLKDDLTRQFCELGSEMDRYADVILNAADPRYIDEIAFSIAHTSPDILRPSGFNANLFADNAASIYANAKYLSYVNLTEKADYTTITYTNATGAKVELPRDIYYWYIVEPKLSDESPLYIDPANGGAAAPPAGKFWRDYLFNHNDSGYPLLRDALAGVPTLWNGTKNAWADNGAIGTITKWMLDSMKFDSGAERPNQPVRIYDLHMGRCGEWEDLTCAAARSALIPCIGAEDIAEDHVWNEFWYDGSWHQWEPVNVYVDFPESYGGWGKTFPAVNAWRGDDFVWTETGMYTQTSTLRVNVNDRNGAPVEGATVWIGNEYSGNAAYRMLASWNCTDDTGVTEFQVGKGNNIYARVDSDLGGSPTGSPQNTGANPWVLLAMDTAQVISNASAPEYCYTFTLSLAITLKEGLFSDGPPLNGSYRMEVGAEVIGGQVRGKSELGAHYYAASESTPVYSFISSEAEYSKFNSSGYFKGYSFSGGTNITCRTLLPNDGKWFAVIGNDHPATIEKVRLTIRFYVSPYITVQQPADHSLFAEGKVVSISGTADGINITGAQLSFDGGSTWKDAVYNGASKGWRFDWNTSGLKSGNYSVRSRLLEGNGLTTGNTVTIAIDADDPAVSVSTTGIMKGGGNVEIAGRATDNNRVATVELALTGPGEAGDLRSATLDKINGTWSYLWPTDGLSSGIFSVLATATDIAGRHANTSMNITLDFDAPTVTVDTNGLFRSGPILGLEGRTDDDIGVRSVAISSGSGWSDATVENGAWHFDWNTTGLPSGKYTVTALAEDFAGWNASASATLALDADAPSIDLVAPQTSEAGDPVHLTGTVSDNNAVDIVEISTDGMNWTELVPDENGDWSFDWYTSDLMPGNFSISVRADDAVGNLAIVSKVVQLVDTIPPQVTIDVPSEIQAGELLTMKVKMIERTGIQKVEYSTDGKTWGEMTYGPKGYSVDINTTTLALGHNRIKVRANDLAGNLGEASKDLTVTDDVAPFVTILALRVNRDSLFANGTAGDNYKIKSVEYTIDNAQWKTLNLSNGSWNISLTKLKAGKCTLTVRATDQGGKTTEVSKEFDIKPVQTGGKGFIPGFGTAALAAALLSGVIALGKRRKGRRL